MTKKLIISPPIILLLLLLFQYTAFAVASITEKADSLRKEIENTTGKRKIHAQLDFALYFLEKDSKQAETIALSALGAAKQQNRPQLQMQAFLMLGRIYHAMNKFKLSQTNYDSALTIANQLKDSWYQCEILFRTGVNQHNTGDHLKALQSLNMSIQAGNQSNNFRIIAASYSMMSTIFRINGLYDRAIEYIIKARLNYQKANFNEGYAWTAYLLGLIYVDLNHTDNAMEYFKLSLKTYEELAQKDNNKGGIAICCEQIGILNLLSGKIDEARNNIEEMLNIYQESGSEYGISNAYKDLGRIEYTAENYALAEKHLNKALDNKKEIEDALSQPTIYLYLGLCYIKTQRYDEGIATIYKGLEKAISNNQKRIQLDIYSSLSTIYLDYNNLENALYCLQQHIDIQESMLSGAATIKLEQLQSIYEVDEKNTQIAALQKQNEINRLQLKQHRSSRLFLIIAILLVMSIAGIIYFFYQRLRQTNSQLKEANTTKDKFFAIIAHDLRGPVHTQTSFLDHLHQEFDSLEKDELKKLLKILVTSSESISDLLDNLLLWAQSQVKKIEVKTEKLVLNDLIENTISKLYQSAKLKQIEISVDTQKKLNVLSDANMLQTVIRNIISNAIKFTPRGGSINVASFISAKGEVVLKITDTGVGIEPDKLNKLFDISNKSYSQGTENEKSSGLGLILVKDFVERNKGSIYIESEPEKGTSVIVSLPSADK